MTVSLTPRLLLSDSFVDRPDGFCAEALFARDWVRTARDLFFFRSRCCDGRLGSKVFGDSVRAALRSDLRGQAQEFPIFREPQNWFNPGPQKMVCPVPNMIGDSFVNLTNFSWITTPMSGLPLVQWPVERTGWSFLESTVPGLRTASISITVTWRDVQTSRELTEAKLPRWIDTS